MKLIILKNYFFFLICFVTFQNVLYGQTTALFDFNTPGQLSLFNGVGNISNLTQNGSIGISGSGGIAVQSNTNAAFSTKDGYSMHLGPLGSKYRFVSFLRSVGGIGYGGLGFTSVSPALAGFNNYVGQNIYRPNDALGISVHGAGFIFHNGSNDYSGGWTSGGVGITTIKSSNMGILDGASPDGWYKFVLEITRVSSTTFDMRVEVYPCYANGTELPSTDNVAIYELHGANNNSISNSPVIHSFFSFSGGRVLAFDNYEITLSGGVSIISEGAPVVLTTSALESNGVVALDGNVTFANGSAVTERGFVYASTTSPTITNSKIIVGSGTGTFSNQTPVLANGTYYFRAYATNGITTSYGSEIKIDISNGSGSGSGSESYEGKVGINTDRPQGIFHVDGGKDNSTTGVPTIAQQANDFTVLSSGNTGVGTTTPSNKLHVVSTVNPLRLNGLVNAAKTDSLLTVDASTGVVRMISANILSEGTPSSSCNPTITSGTISHNQPYGCSGYNPGVFTSSPAEAGLGGTVSYTWQESIDGGATWSLAAGTNNTQNYDPPALTLPTRYRRVAANYCGAVYSNAVDIAIDGASSGIVATPCAFPQGGNTSLSIGLYTGSTVVSWSVSPSSGLSFSSTSSSTTTLSASSSATPGNYTVTVTITSAACGNKIFTKTITVLPIGVDVSNLKKSCKEILDAGLSTGNGTYWVDPDGGGNAYCAEQVYCNMTDNGGGWTLILKSMNNNADFQYSSGIWASGSVFNTSDFDISNASTANALYPTYNYLVAQEFWVDFVTTPDLTPFKVPTAGTPKAFANSTLNANIANQYLNQPLQTTGMSSTYFSPANAYSYQTGGVGNGANLGAGYANVKFGMLSNNENNEIFNSSDSAIGIGAFDKNGSGVTVGNYGSGNAFFNAGNSGFLGTNGLGFYKAILWAR